MEGPQFSTRAESHLYRSWGATVIGMTVIQEAKLAREAEICFATVALVTDYDCWHETEESVKIETVLGYLRSNAEMARKVIASGVASIPDQRSCACGSALASAIITDRSAIPPATLERLGLLVDKYLD
jgi:5'-methylthioadenosine phosphorylase